jgi:hypothetical protein
MALAIGDALSRGVVRRSDARVSASGDATKRSGGGSPTFAAGASVASGRIDAAEPGRHDTLMYAARTLVAVFVGAVCAAR